MHENRNCVVLIIKISKENKILEVDAKKETNIDQKGLKIYLIKKFLLISKEVTMDVNGFPISGINNK